MELEEKIYERNSSRLKKSLTEGWFLSAMREGGDRRL